MVVELIPIIYIVALAILADVTGSFRKIGGFAAFWIMLFLTPLVGWPIVLLFPRLKKAYCLKDYKPFHAGIAYRYKVLTEGIGGNVAVVNDREVLLSMYEFTEYFAVVESRKAYNKRRQADGFVKI